jgi:hypothetical protein
MSVDPSIERLYRVLLEELRLPYFPCTQPNDQRAMSDFLFVVNVIQETPGGPLKPADVRAVIRRRWEEKIKHGARWKMTLQSILRDPEQFRDQVLECRRPVRPRPPVKRVATARADGSMVLTEASPVAQADPPPMDEQTRRFLDDLEAFKRRKKEGSKP